ncbi:unnamed protein product [Strongylus vulgaris]|uniref:Uncharacterized protein n=1 Tax=Strongylus vulgaris TaxID=40348 RepID=A0A3P7KGK8_STRVU|nr:unnamed protein product [Strongylus vulgaris]
MEAHFEQPGTSRSSTVAACLEKPALLARWNCWLEWPDTAKHKEKSLARLVELADIADRSNAVKTQKPWNHVDTAFGAQKS